MAKDVTVYEVLADGEGQGPAGDGTYVRRFRTEAEALAFAKVSTCYGGKCRVQTCVAPRALARRWGIV
jgi:hypothetical protein